MTSNGLAKRLHAVLLEQIDCKLLMASPGGSLDRGEIFGIEYTTLSRIS